MAWPRDGAGISTASLYIALQQLPELGHVRTARLIQHFSCVDAVLGASDDAWRALGLPELARSALAELSSTPEVSAYYQQALLDLSVCEEQSWQIVHWESAEYPPLLREIPLPPPLLYVAGDVSALGRRQVAMVGSRRATHAGQATAENIAGGLAHAGLAVCSGLALGIDACSHRACLQSSGTTVAVLGSGLRQLYPRRNAALAAEIMQSGAVVSEFSINTPPASGNFPTRNRIISGLSEAVVVVEAALRSGSLITARDALEQNRIVCAVPGSVHAPQSAGCNRLIQQGATLVCETADVIQQLQGFLDWEADENMPAEEAALARELAELLSHIGFEPTSGEELIARSGQSAAAVAAGLVELQLLGRVQRDGDSYSKSGTSTRKGTSTPKGTGNHARERAP